MLDEFRKATPFQVKKVPSKTEENSSAALAVHCAVSDFVLIRAS